MSQHLEGNQTEELTEFVKSEARRLGFSLVGITTLEPPPHTQVFEKWLDEGHHGEMDYLGTSRAKQYRADPRLILPDCQSIVVLAANYLPLGPMAGAVAAYAVGDDYHQVLADRLKQLVSSLENRLGRKIENRYYTDTGPIMERELAQRAGLGWIGKNTCLINPQHGSYFFLAEIFLDLPLKFDEPLKTDHCGECTLCIEACPTACILPNRTLDAARCISYLTIEHKSSVPHELRTQLGGWIFGCDICQQVCPWNLRFAKPTADVTFQARPLLKDPIPSDFLQLSITDYRRELSKSPLKRAKHAGLMRNAALAAANSRDRSSIPDLKRLVIEADDPMIRAHAAWALGQFGEIKTLHDALSAERDPEVVDEIERALEDSGSGG